MHSIWRIFPFRQAHLNTKYGNIILYDIAFITFNVTLPASFGQEKYDHIIRKSSIQLTCARKTIVSSIAKQIDETP